MIVPLPGFVLVEVLKEDTEEKGYLLPETVAEKPAKGKVLAVGEISKDAPVKHLNEYLIVYPQVKVGDKVVFKRYMGQDVRDEGIEVKLVAITDLMGVIHG